MEEKWGESKRHKRNEEDAIDSGRLCRLDNAQSKMDEGRWTVDKLQIALTSCVPERMTRGTFLSHQTCKLKFRSRELISCFCCVWTSEAALKIDA